MGTAIVWFRNNLRIHDNEALAKACKHDRVIPVYIFDPQWFGQTSFGFPKTGSYRTRFLIESVRDLRKSLRALGSGLVIRKGDTSQQLFKLVNDVEADIIYAPKEVTAEELAIEEAAQENSSVPVNFVRTHTLFHPEDLPFPKDDIQDVFTDFRKQIEKKSSVRACYEKPVKLPEIDIEDVGSLPRPDDLGAPAKAPDERAVFLFKGGEVEALRRLQQYFWDQDQLKNYKFTRNGLLGADYSSKFSPWLANGGLSPRLIYWEVKRYEEQRKSNVSTYWMIFELIWRDFFRYSAIKNGNNIFKQGGIQQKDRNWRKDDADFKVWAEGQTGIPFIDANMRELNRTGYMSNRGRQNVASF